MTGRAPLLAPRDLEAPFAWLGGRPVSARRFLADARAQAARLAAEGEAVINLCSDRYRFTVLFAAALLRGRRCLLPPDALPATLARLGGQGMEALGDADVPAPEHGADDRSFAAGAYAGAVADGGAGGDVGAGAGAGAGGTAGAGSGGDADAAACAVAEACAGADVGAGASAGAGVGAGAGAGAGTQAAAVHAEAEAEAGAGAGVHAVPLPTIALDTEAACLLTSGSTGDPQPHAKRWGQLVANLAAQRDRLAAHLGRPDLAGLTIVATVPAQHSYGFESSVLLALLGGAAFDAGRPYFPADVAEALARVPRPRALVTTPFHLKNVLAAGLELPPVDLLLSATAPLSPQLAAQAERAFGAPLIEVYGCTEAGQVATRRSVETDVWTCYGALTVHAEPGDERYLVVGGHVSEPTPLADVLELQDERRFRLLGRAGDVIHVAGRRTSLAHLDYQLNAVEGVVDAAVWMPRDVADGVARPVAFVVAPTLSVADIRRALRGRLEAVFIPRRIVKLDRLPREATGKLKASQLERLAATHSGGRA